MSDQVPELNNQNPMEIDVVLFWITLVLGAVSGSAAYFILRTIHEIKWYTLAPVLFVVNFVCIFYFASLRLNKSMTKDTKEILMLILKNTGTWIIVYFAFGTAMFYFGW